MSDFRAKCSNFNFGCGSSDPLAKFNGLFLRNGRRRGEKLKSKIRQRRRKWRGPTGWFTLPMFEILK